MDTWKNARESMEAYRDARAAFMAAYDVMTQTPRIHGPACACRANRARDMRRAERVMDRKRRDMERAVMLAARESGTSPEYVVSHLYVTR